MQSDEPRTRILLAAGPVFAEKGYKSATVREICQAAEVNVASINYYFGDKERLYIETVKEARKLRGERFSFPQWLDSDSAEKRLRDYIRTMLFRMIGEETAPWHGQLMMREVLRPTSACRELVEEYFRPDFELLMTLLGELLPEDVPTHELRKLGFSVIGQCLFYRVAGEVAQMLTPEDEFADECRVDQLAEHIARFTLAAVGAEQPWTTGCQPTTDPPKTVGVEP